MKSGQPIDLPGAKAIDALCDRFEAAWRKGEKPPIEDYLDEVDGGMQRPLFQSLLQVEWELRPPARQDIEDYLQRFPQFEHTIQDLLRDLPPEVGAGPLPSWDETASLRRHTEDTSSRNAGRDEAEATPRHIGRFQIRERLGQGAFGAVYRAYDPHLDRQVALKLPRVVPRDAADMERFLREARAASRLRHPNICPVYEVGEIDGCPFLVMALISGRTLSDGLRDGSPLPQQNAARIAQKLALAIAEAHQRGIVHRDLKPANVLIDETGEPVVTDFGLARREDANDAQLTQAGEILGTPAYMSPEQARGDRDTIGPATDIYSLGAILYELLTNRRPFSGTAHEVLAQLLTDPPPPPSAARADVDPSLEAICLKALSKRVEDRQESMSELAAELTRWLEHQTRSPSEPTEAATVAMGTTDALASQAAASVPSIQE